MKENVQETQSQVRDGMSEQLGRLEWIPVREDQFLWIPPGLSDSQTGWFVKLLVASLRSEQQGYLPVPRPEVLWQLAGAQHPETWKRYGSMVLARFQRAQLHGQQVLFFPPLVKIIEEQQ